MAKRRYRVHAFRHNTDLGTDHNGKRFCADCPLVEDHPVHDLPETTQAARDRDASILGEKEEA